MNEERKTIGVEPVSEQAKQLIHYSEQNIRWDYLVDQARKLMPKRTFHIKFDGFQLHSIVCQTMLRTDVTEINFMDKFFRFSCTYTERAKDHKRY
jgi:hypothetical protein